MATLKLVVWNMEWMNDLFGPNDAAATFKPDGATPFHHPNATVKKRRDDLAGVLNELAPDIVVIVEGPNRTAELQLFFDADVNGEWLTHIQPSKGSSQCIGVAVRVDEAKFAAVPFKLWDTTNEEAFAPFDVDTDDDEIQEQYRFERMPLYVELRPQAGTPFRILALHLKSKGIFGALEWSKWWAVADANRRKLLAQATQLRLRFLDPYLSSNETKAIPLIVCGDINDGPGLDASEKRLFGSAVERLMGTVWKPQFCLGNALYDALPSGDQRNLNFAEVQTTSFKDPIFNNVWHREWIDHILYTNNHAAWVTAGLIHDYFSGDLPIWEKYRHASDHFPISVTITL